MTIVTIDGVEKMVQVRDGFAHEVTPNTGKTIGESWEVRNNQICADVNGAKMAIRLEQK